MTRPSTGAAESPRLIDETSTALLPHVTTKDLCASGTLTGDHLAAYLD